MLIDELVQFCHTELQTKPCRGCTKTGSGDCGHNCKNCLDDLHYHQNCIRCDYTCERQLGRYRTLQWFRALVRNVVAQKLPSSPFLVIFNDVDSRNTGRDTFPAFRSIVEEAGLHVNFERRMCFKPDSYYADAQQYPSRRNQFQLPSFVKDNYTPAINCESAQLILEVQ